MLLPDITGRDASGLLVALASCTAHRDRDQLTGKELADAAG
ncbi:hypothetical protein [Streptomyces sp. ATCC 21386]|nr:hypothetical protein [Streptomyces sp. ATCC 21386]